MKAIRVAAHGGPEVLRPAELPVPAPGSGEALVRLAATGVNFIEVYQRRGEYAMQLPYTPGSEAAGVVERVGPGVTGLKPGDRVATARATGTYAEWALAPADQLVAIPEGVEARLAAAVMLQGMTAHYLTHTTFPLRPGDACVVHAAAGGVGLLLCQLARRRGARVFGLASGEEKAARARAAGAEVVIDAGRADFAAEVRRWTDGRGVAVVYDSVGRTTFAGSLDCLAPRGMLVLFGQSSGAVEPFDPQVLNRKGSLFLTRPSLHHYAAGREEMVARAGDVLGWVRDGSLRVRIDHEFPLAEAAQAHRALESRRTSGKLLLVP